ncbi:hypothetical protein HMPREF1554_00624 [Porphyromonas gingivalis F0569]|uniref:Uncharacterized protein n=1 Tax=Porphyromonas gingivalis F0570 TaxID=1227271 RepID=A0A0E2LSF5_PORGN|nr:hypothetical protein HMPREF1555_00646 [Porphyromonas gingivalis F0570]ERJ68172.1 hypothetical protein HMPREF1553_01201 [Porphyromonas gingivalis F0568]ERJ69374.1 hypothetical protein HMPREF1554_00624 [Porphyromonas gingivalis F0569]
MRDMVFYVNNFCLCLQCYEVYINWTIGKGFVVEKFSENFS